MKQLDKVIKKNGYIHELVERNQFVAIYERENTDFEVFVVRVEPPKEAFGKLYPQREIFPANEDFGTYAWACATLERAEQRYDWLNKVLKIKYAPSIFLLDVYPEGTGKVEKVPV